MVEVCSYCGEEGHSIQQCPKWRGKAEATAMAVPFLFKGLHDEVKAALAEEEEAIDNYAELENKLRNAGFNEDADIVHEIRGDEIDHRAKFEVMLKTHSPSNSFYVKYVDLEAGKTLEKTIPSIEQFNLMKLQREGKIAIIEIHKVKGD